MCQGWTCKRASDWAVRRSTPASTNHVTCLKFFFQQIAAILAEATESNYLVCLHILWFLSLDHPILENVWKGVGSYEAHQGQFEKGVDEAKRYTACYRAKERCLCSTLPTTCGRRELISVLLKRRRWYVWRQEQSAKGNHSWLYIEPVIMCYVLHVKHQIIRLYVFSRGGGGSSLLPRSNYF